MRSGIPQVIRKIFRIIAWLIGSVVLLLILIALLIQIPAVQRKLTGRAVAFLEEKIGTEVSLEGISISFPKSIVLKGIYLEDQEGDTLLYAGRLSINTDLWALTQRQIQLNDVDLENTVAFVDRPEADSAFNFTYILNAFAGDSTAVPDTLEQKGWNFLLHELSLTDIRLQYHDLLLGNHATASIGEFDLEMSEFDLKNNRFGVAEVVLANTNAKFRQTKLPPANPETEKTADSTAALVLSLETLGLANVDLNYEQSVLGQAAQLKIGEFTVNAEEIDLANQEVALTTVDLHDSFIGYHQERADTNVAPQADAAGGDSSASTWKIAVHNLDVSNNSITYEDATEPRQPGSVDFNHLSITNFNIDAGDIRYRPDNIYANVRLLSFKEQSGFALNRLRAKVDITETEAKVGDLVVQTGNSRLAMDATANFPSLANIGKTWTQARLTSEVRDSYINVKDILYFQPSLLDSLPLSLPPTANLRVDAAVHGTIEDLTIEHLIFATLSETTLRTSGRITGLPETDNLRMNVALNKFYSTRIDLETILPDTLLPDSMKLPAWINLEAEFQGTMEKAKFKSLLTSATGTIDMEGSVNLDSASALRGVDATINIHDFDVGGVLGKPDSVMNKLEMQAKIHTNGLVPEEMTGTLTALVGRFDFKGYQYNDLTLNGEIRNQVLSLNASMRDKNLNFALDAGYNFKEEVPRYIVTLDVKNADFEALNFSESPIRGRGTLMVNLATSDFKVLNGNVGIRKVAIFNGDELYAIDSLLFASIDQEGRSEVHIDSDLLTANFEGSINIFSLPGVVREYANSYYSLHDSLEVKDAGNQHFTFDINLKNTKILTGLLVPQLTTFVPGEIRGEFDSEEKKLDLRMEIDEIQYADIGIRSLVFSTNSDPVELNYNLIVDRIMIDSMKIDGLAINGTVANDSGRSELIILDSADREKYVLAATFFSLQDEFALKLIPGEIVLNYQPWSVPEDNIMRFGGEKFVADNVQLTNMRERIIIESKEEPGTPIFIGFRELNLEYLSSMIAGERPLSGLLEGDVNIYPDSAAMTFTSDITIDDFRIQNVAWGDVALQVEQTIADRFDVNFRLSGNRNDVTVEGMYTGGQSPALDLTARIRQFNLVSLQPLVSGQLENLTGTLRGEIVAKGSVQRPDIDGRILVANAKFLSTYLNSTFSLEQETISFVDEGIAFNAFEIADENNNKARISGTMLTRNYRDFRFNLDVFTDRFRLLDTRAGDNELFYGLVEVSANARIRGDMTTPIINIDIALNEGTDLTYVVPQSEAAVLETEGIVRFVDKTFEGDPFMERTKVEASDTVKSGFRGIDLTARIELTDEETFTIIIDPITQDQLTVSGNSTLTLNIDPTGDIRLTGRYEITEGTYNLSFYKFVKREFAIESGSTITWTGDPLNARMDIRAIYDVETAPLDLFSNQLTGADASEVNRYKQRIPFLVYLNITGELLQPEISFELDMPMDVRNIFGGTVYARLQDINTRESDLNKQVFALLILKRFISDNPFENQAAGGFESTARRSVSKILSEQLNRLSENIKGVELSFDIKSYEDYTSGEAEGRTELQLGFSKSLLNDRLVVKLSGNIDIEGEDAKREATDYIGDLAIEYKLTPDGRFRITGFRNSNYDMIDGELTETGVGLIYVKDYNSLSELFKANAETKN